MKNIIDNYYENGHMKDFTKVSSIYMQWYAAYSEGKKKGAEIIHKHVVEISKELGKKQSSYNPLTVYFSKRMKKEN